MKICARVTSLSIKEFRYLQGNFAIYEVNSIPHSNFIVYMGNFTDRRRCIYHKGEVVGWDLGGVGVDNFPPLYIDRLEPKHHLYSLIQTS